MYKGVSSRILALWYSKLLQAYDACMAGQLDAARPPLLFVLERMKENIWQNFDKEDIPEGICCVCGHKLSSHVFEGDGWRCHQLSVDGCQCECYLRQAGTDTEQGASMEFQRNFYDLRKRCKESKSTLFDLMDGTK
jgi:hypothetical protein